MSGVPAPGTNLEGAAEGLAAATTAKDTNITWYTSELKGVLTFWAFCLVGMCEAS